jgi:transposase
MGEARVVRPDRRQLRWDMIDLDGLLPLDHRARIVWSFVESLDLSPLYDQVLSREGEAGRPAADPAVLLALWLYATVEGVGWARELERLTQSNVAYRGLAGGVPVNDHGLADFRIEPVDGLDRLLTQSVTALIGEGLMSLAEIAVDGTKIRASASKTASGRAKNCSRSKPRLALAFDRPQAGVDRRPRSFEPSAPSGARACGARCSGAGGKSAGGARTARGGAENARGEAPPKDEARKKEPKASTTEP